MAINGCQHPDMRRAGTERDSTGETRVYFWCRQCGALGVLDLDEQGHISPMSRHDMSGIHWWGTRKPARRSGRERG